MWSKFKVCLGITKAYTTRVGEDLSNRAKDSGEKGYEFGTVTKKRCGWLMEKDKQ